MKRFVVIQFEIEGVHHWPDCPHEDVAYLRDKHRHVFHVRTATAVGHGDREIEIIRHKRAMMRWLVKAFPRYKGGCLDFGKFSCEMIAEAIINEFGCDWCRVLEDGENGALVMRDA